MSRTVPQLPGMGPRPPGAPGADFDLNMQSASLRAAPLVQELQEAWRVGFKLRVEEMLADRPEVSQDEEVLLRLVYEELCLRQEGGDADAAAEAVRRFPRLNERLQILLNCHDALTNSTPRFPEAGERLGDFFLVKELGRGAEGRVFLSLQPALADRPIVVKLSPLAGEEHLSLARLQHAHIVPIYFFQPIPERGLQAICMPYLGGLTLAGALQALQEIPAQRRSGKDLVRVLDESAAAAAIALPPFHHGPFRQLLLRSNYAQAVCWLGAALADALQYAHDRNLVHLDVKPSNILLASDGQPMLLDFHLARSPIPEGTEAPTSMGGTPAYMPPEQGLCLASVREREALLRSLDGRADIFSLGVVLFEALTGERLKPGKLKPVELPRRNSQVSIGLADILARCLQSNLDDRYLRAGDLANDLRRHLMDRPLHGAANRSIRERWQKWRRRRPHALLLLALSITVFLAILLAGLGRWHHAQEQRRLAEDDLAEGERLVHSGQYVEADRTFSRGHQRAQQNGASVEIMERLAEQKQKAQRAVTASRLHALVERLRCIAQLETLPRGIQRTWDVAWKEMWNQRETLGIHAGVALDQTMETQIRQDLADLVFLRTELDLALAETPDDPSIRQQASERLDEVRRLIGTSPLLESLRSHYQSSEAGPFVFQAETSVIAPAWEETVRARQLLRAGELATARRVLDRGLAAHPGDFWLNSYRGILAMREGNAQTALPYFHVGVALAPGQAQTWYNRGAAFAALGSSDEALHDYERALRIDPQFSAAAFNRGVLHYRQGALEAALSDLGTALRCGADPAVTHYNLGLVFCAKEEWSAARNHLEKALALNPKHEKAGALLSQLRDKGR